MNGTKPRAHVAPAVAAVAIALLVGFTIRHNSFTPWGTDAAAYIRSAHQWAQSELFSPATVLFWAPWGLEGELESPLGQRPGPERGTLVSQYPLGFPVLMATAIRLGGPPSLAGTRPSFGAASPPSLVGRHASFGEARDLAPYLVAPMFAGVLAWCAYVLASQLAGPWAGVLAVIQVAASPITAQQAMVPMSDLPAAALWAVTWVMSLRPSTVASVAAGMAGAAAIMVRPNLAPLALVIAATILFDQAASSHERWKRVIAFAACVVGGTGLLLWSQAVQYGHPLTPGYTAYQQFFVFSTARILENARNYPALLAEAHSIGVFIGFLGIALFAVGATPSQDTGLPRRSSDPLQRAKAGAITLSAIGLIAVNFALYLPYTPFRDLPSLRFMLPAMTALFVLNAAVAEHVRSTLASYSGLLAPLALVPILAISVYSHELVRTSIVATPAQQRIVLMGRYLREALPSNAVVINYLQNAAIAFYTGKTIVRMDPIADPSTLDRIIDDLRRHGYHPVFVVDKAFEAEYFQTRFGASQYHRLDWPPRAEFIRGGTVWYIDPADRERYRRGERWPIDVVE